MIDEIVFQIKKTQKFPLMIIGIDGPGGVGKTTLAKKLEERLKSAQIVHMDDFDVSKKEKMSISEDRPVGPDTKWHRVLNEVLIPLKSGINVKYKGYDRGRDLYLRKVALSPIGIVIVEGVFALRREIFSHYDFSIWVDCSLNKRIERAMRRDGEAARDLWENDWLPMEDKYIKVYDPSAYADIVINTD